MPYTTLIGLDDEPAELAGYGPIPASVARRIAAGGTWRRLLTDPATGALLDYGTTRYSAPQDLAELVIARDRTCRGVGCRQPAHLCDLDHTIPAPHGPTNPGNHAPLCRTIHIAKTHHGWRLSQDRPGYFRWTTPTGHEYSIDPEHVGPIVEHPDDPEADEPDAPP